MIENQWGRFTQALNQSQNYRLPFNTNISGLNHCFRDSWCKQDFTLRVWRTSVDRCALSFSYRRWKLDSTSLNSGMNFKTHTRRADRYCRPQKQHHVWNSSRVSINICCVWPCSWTVCRQITHVLRPTEWKSGHTLFKCIFKSGHLSASVTCEQLFSPAYSLNAKLS